LADAARTAAIRWAVGVGLMLALSLGPSWPGGAQPEGSDAEGAPSLSPTGLTF